MSQSDAADQVHGHDTIDWKPVNNRCIRTVVSLGTTVRMEMRESCWKEQRLEEGNSAKE